MMQHTLIEQNILIAMYDKHLQTIFSTPTLKPKAPPWKKVQLLSSIENVSSEVTQRKLWYRQQPELLFNYFLKRLK